MLDAVRQKLEKAILDNGASPIGIIEGGPQRIMLFRYRGLDMAMYVDEIGYQSVKRHIEQKITRYMFPICKCGEEMPANMTGMTCTKCLFRYSRTA